MDSPSDRRALEFGHFYPEGVASLSPGLLYSATLGRQTAGAGQPQRGCGYSFEEQAPWQGFRLASVLRNCGFNEAGWLLQIGRSYRAATPLGLGSITWRRSPG